jgi:hypothetical protein
MDSSGRHGPILKPVPVMLLFPSHVVRYSDAKESNQQQGDSHRSVAAKLHGEEEEPLRRSSVPDPGEITSDPGKPTLTIAVRMRVTTLSRRFRSSS